MYYSERSVLLTKAKKNPNSLNLVIETQNQGKAQDQDTSLYTEKAQHWKALEKCKLPNTWLACFNPTRTGNSRMKL